MKTTITSEPIDPKKLVSDHTFPEERLEVSELAEPPEPVYKPDASYMYSMLCDTCSKFLGYVFEDNYDSPYYCSDCVE